MVLMARPRVVVVRGRSIDVTRVSAERASSRGPGSDAPIACHSFVHGVLGDAFIGLSGREDREALTGTIEPPASPTSRIPVTMSTDLAPIGLCALSCSGVRSSGPGMEKAAESGRR